MYYRNFRKSQEIIHKQTVKFSRYIKLMVIYLLSKYQQ